jgi:hypothetical protein
MLSYYLSTNNIITIRVQAMTPSTLIWKVEDMFSLENWSASISGYDYNPYESILEFTASLPSPYVGGQYRATIENNGSEIWRGTVSVFTSQSIDKPNYTNQIPLENVYKSNVTDNEYIIMQ